MANVQLHIKGMSCGCCVNAVGRALKGLNGISDFEVEVGSAAVTYDAQTISVEKLKEAVEEAGYNVFDAMS